MNLITYQEARTKDSTIYIDVRSPEEFRESTIPGAVNIPILNNEERTKVGTIYNQESPAQAKMLGVELIAPKLPELLKEVKSVIQDYKNIVIFCSRGGLRSESVVSFCELIGLKNVHKLEGGYKSYRRFILNKLEEYNLTGKLLVIYGFTGVGKTDLLYKLEERGLPIIDLEKLANHRGSAFGSIGLGEPTNQKHFDSLLWERLEELKDEPVIAVEGESKRIGMSILPPFFIEAMQEGIHVLFKNSMESRVERIISEYSSSYEQDKEAFIDRALESLEAVKKHLIQQIGKDGYEKLIDNCRSGKLETVVETLLTNYYDRMYKHSQQDQEDFSLVVKEENLEKAADKIIDNLELIMDN
jgi:tRNA 2-selenouridine synthase